MAKLAKFVAAVIAASVSGAAHAGITLDFEGSSLSAPPGSTAVSIDQFYNGGTDSGGTSGTDLGISFTNANFDSSSQYTHPEYGITSSIAYMLNSPLIFTADTAFTSITFDAFFFGGGNVVNIWSGADGTGTLLASQTYSQNCSPFCAPISYSMSFANALSVTISPNANGTGIDNLIIGSVPEPATWLMMALGFGAIGFSIRRKRRKLALAAV